MAAAVVIPSSIDVGKVQDVVVMFPCNIPQDQLVMLDLCCAPTSQARDQSFGSGRSSNWKSHVPTQPLGPNTLWARLPEIPYAGQLDVVVKVLREVFTPCPHFSVSVLSPLEVIFQAASTSHRNERQTSSTPLACLAAYLLHTHHKDQRSLAHTDSFVSELLQSQPSLCADWSLSSVVFGKYGPSESLLHLLVRCKLEGAVAILLENTKGKEEILQQKDYKGRAPAEIARKKGCKKAAKMLTAAIVNTSDKNTADTGGKLTRSKSVDQGINKTCNSDEDTERSIVQSVNVGASGAVSPTGPRYSLTKVGPPDKVGPHCPSSEPFGQLVSKCLYSASVLQDYHWLEPPFRDKASLKRGDIFYVMRELENGLCHGVCNMFYWTVPKSSLATEAFDDDMAYEKTSDTESSDGYEMVLDPFVLSDEHIPHQSVQLPKAPVVERQVKPPSMKSQIRKHATLNRPGTNILAQVAVDPSLSSSHESGLNRLGHCKNLQPHMNPTQNPVPTASNSPQYTTHCPVNIPPNALPLPSRAQKASALPQANWRDQMPHEPVGSPPTPPHRRESAPTPPTPERQQRDPFVPEPPSLPPPEIRQAAAPPTQFVLPPRLPRKEASNAETTEHTLLEARQAAALPKKLVLPPPLPQKEPSNTEVADNFKVSQAMAPNRFVLPPPLPRKDSSTTLETEPVSLEARQTMAPTKLVLPPPLPHKDPSNSQTNEHVSLEARQAMAPTKLVFPPPLPQKDPSNTQTINEHVSFEARLAATKFVPQAPPLPRKDEVTEHVPLEAKKAVFVPSAPPLPSLEAKQAVAPTFVPPPPVLPKYSPHKEPNEQHPLLKTRQAPVAPTNFVLPQTAHKRREKPQTELNRGYSHETRQNVTTEIFASPSLVSQRRNTPQEEANEHILQETRQTVAPAKFSASPHVSQRNNTPQEETNVHALHKTTEAVTSTKLTPPAVPIRKDSCESEPKKHATPDTRQAVPLCLPPLVPQRRDTLQDEPNEPATEASHLDELKHRLQTPSTKKKKVPPPPVFQPRQSAQPPEITKTAATPVESREPSQKQSVLPHESRQGASTLPQKKKKVPLPPGAQMRERVLPVVKPKSTPQPETSPEPPDVEELYDDVGVMHNYLQERHVADEVQKNPVTRAASYSDQHLFEASVSRTVEHVIPDRRKETAQHQINKHPTPPEMASEEDDDGEEDYVDASSLEQPSPSHSERPQTQPQLKQQWQQQVQLKNTADRPKKSPVPVPKTRTPSLDNHTHHQHHLQQQSGPPAVKQKPSSRAHNRSFHTQDPLRAVRETQHTPPSEDTAQPTFAELRKQLQRQMNCS